MSSLLENRKIRIKDAKNIEKIRKFYIQNKAISNSKDKEIEILKKCRGIVT